ncbi:MAG: hypothetical protein IME96_00305 [Proteobacteria bacterium]|nr:hypothetical protein [Pseudomonadota bacterium]
MAAKKAPNFRNASEWMEFYESLFEEEEPVKSDPLPLNGEEGLTDEEFLTYKKFNI